MKSTTFFYPGIHTDFHGRQFNIGGSLLQKSVEKFNASGAKLPLVVGHPRDESDSFGFITKLAIDEYGNVSGDGYEGMDPSFQKIVKAGELGKVSAKLLMPGHPDNPYPDAIDFKHLGFFGINDVALDKLPVATFSKSNSNEVVTLPQDELELRLKALEAKEAEFAAKQKELAQKEAIFAAQTDLSPRVEKLIKSGCIPPAMGNDVLAVLVKLSADSEIAASFAASKKNPIDILEAAFAAKAVPLGESKEDPEEGDDDDEGEKSGSFAATKMSPASVALDKKVRAEMKKSGCSYPQAAKKVAMEAK